MRSPQLAFLSLLIVVLIGCVSLGNSKVVELTGSNFETEIYSGLGDSSEGIEWIIEFYTPWCSVCRQFNPVFSVVSKQYQDSGSKMRFGKVNADEELALSARFMISSIPTVYYVKISPGEEEKVYQVKTAMNEQDWAKTLASQQWTSEQPWDSYFAPFSISWVSSLSLSLSCCSLPFLISLHSSFFLKNSGKLLYVVAKWVAIAWVSGYSTPSSEISSFIRSCALNPL